MRGVVSNTLLAVKQGVDANFEAASSEVKLRGCGDKME